MDLEFTPEDRRFREEARSWLVDHIPRGRRAHSGTAMREFDLTWQRAQFEGGGGGGSPGRRNMVGSGCRLLGNLFGTRNMHVPAHRITICVLSHSIMPDRRSLHAAPWNKKPIISPEFSMAK